LPPIQHRRPEQAVIASATCPRCEAPADYLYFNDGKKRSQLRCKVCDELFQIGKRHRAQAKYWCPHCQAALFRWKVRPLETIYKCPNDNCPAYRRAKNQLSDDEKKLQQERSSQFKLHYQYREHHYTESHLQHAAPSPSRVDLGKIHHPPHLVGLILAFHVSFAIGARKTAQVLRQIFGITISYQTVLNYAEAAAYYCHLFNLANKGGIDDHSAGDETYIKICGRHAYVFFFISAVRRTITAYHVADSRGTLPATVAMREATRTARPDQAVVLITDGNPAYPDGIHFLNAQSRKVGTASNNAEISSAAGSITHHKVIGLQNLDSESEEFRPYKQLIERLNRTYKYHIRAANGFGSWNGAIALTALFVTHYNFLRPHLALRYNVPIPRDDLAAIPLLQNQWCHIIDAAAQLA
jgi:transposase-like protein